MPEVAAAQVKTMPETQVDKKTPVAVVQERIDALEVEAKRRIDHILESGSAGLTRLDQFLARVSTEDWTVTGLRRRLDGLRGRAENARASAMKRMDEIPGEAVSALASAGRARIQDLSRGLRAIAKRLEPPAEPPRAVK
jgi:hypothetical protein